MASWKLCAVLLICVLLALVAQSEAGRGRGGGRRRQEEENLEDGDELATTDEGEDDDETVGRRGGRGRGGGRGGGRNRGGGGRGGGGRSRGRGGGRGRNQSGDRQGGRGRGRGGAGEGNNKHARRCGGRRRTLPEKALRLATAMASSVGQVSLKLYREMATRNANNFVISPYSVFSAMTMLMLATGGQSKRQMISGLEIQSAIHSAVGCYNDSLAQSNSESTRLSVANALYIKSGFEYSPRFVNKLQRFYESQVSEFPAEKPEDAVNAWVEEKTNGEIQDILADGEVTPEMVLMLVNAIYFKGKWKEPFDSARTTMQPFFVTPTQRKEVLMMRREGQYKLQHSTALGAKILELPYDGDRFGLYIVLPEQNTDLRTVESRLTQQVLNETLSANAYVSSMEIEVPKFSLDTDQSMKEILQAMGIQDVFDPRRANLRKMTNSRNVFVGQVRHRAVIKLDEEGTVAAGSTSVGIMLTSLPQQFKVNRPFMFILRDKEKNMNLFVGRYTDPQGDNIL